MSKKENPSEGLAASQDGEQLSKEQIIRARSILKQEREWRADPEQGKIFQSEVENFAVHEMEQRRPFSMQGILERLRWKDRTNSQGHQVKVSNNFGAIWSRLLIQRYGTEMAKCIQLRPSIFDQIKPSW